MDDNTMRMIVIAIIAGVAALLVLWLMRRRRTTTLRARFGPEYDHALRTAASPAAAERELEQRQRRVKAFSLHALTREQAEHFTSSWRAVQAKFVDDPRTATLDADRLITEVMRSRGYPMEDPARRLDDLSVDHASVVSHYRSGRDIVQRHERGEVGTEELRQAMVHFRALFDELVGDARRIGRAS
jgi:hypothetical protein